MTDDEPITLPKVKASDFDLFLSVLYPMWVNLSPVCVRMITENIFCREFGQYTATTVSEWTAILDLAAKWNFKSVRALAVKHLAPIASPIDKIVLGRKHSINEWLGDAYRSVCTRPEPLTHDEGMRLGMGDVIKISAIRYDYGLRLVRRSPLSLKEELQKRFGLDSPAFPTLHDALNMKEEEAAKPQTRKSVEDWLEKAQLEKPMEVPMDDYADLDTRTHKSVESWLEKTQPKNIAVPVDNYVDFDKHQGPIDWTAVTDDGEAHAYEPVREIIETTDRAENDDSMGRDVRPLTRPQQKKKKQQEAKEAKERADRAFQEQLEKELAEEGMKDDPSLYNDRYY